MKKAQKQSSIPLFAIFLFTIVAIIFMGCGQECAAQTQTTPKTEQKIWTEEDRQYLVSELERTRDEIVSATEYLSPDQWHFKPSENSWNIAQVVEHLGIYERLFLQEAWVANNLPPRPQYYERSISDSLYLAWMADKSHHTAPENAVPLGFMKGKDNLIFFLYGRNLVINYVRDTDKDLKAQFTPRGGEPNNLRSIHGLFVVHFGHTDRHLRQIERIKSDPNYPDL